MKQDKPLDEEFQRKAEDKFDQYLSEFDEGPLMNEDLCISGNRERRKLLQMIQRNLINSIVSVILPIRSSHDQHPAGDDLGPSRSVTLWVAHDM